MTGHLEYFSHISTKNVWANLKWLLRNTDTLWFCKISFYFTSPFNSYIRSIVSQLHNSTVKKNEGKKIKKSKQAEWRCWNQPHHNRKKPRTESIWNKLCSILGSVVYLKLLWSINVALLLQKNKCTSGSLVIITDFFKYANCWLKSVSPADSAAQKLMLPN